MMSRTLTLVVLGLFLPQLPISADPPAARLKELVSLEGVRDNQLIGYGIVVGLKGTGDRQQTLFTAQSLTNMLQQMGVTVNAATILVRNTAAAMVTATLPPFAQPGMQIDVTVAAMGDCASLQGGLLLMTSLRGINGQVYSIAQGPVVTGGFILGGAGNTQTVNHPTVGRIPGGAIVEKPAPSVTPSTQVRLQLHEADFTTAARIAEAVNRHFTTEASPIRSYRRSRSASKRKRPATWSSKKARLWRNWCVRLPPSAPRRGTLSRSYRVSAARAPWRRSFK